MDTILHDILINTYNPNSQQRTEAEQSLNFFLQSSGALYSLLSFISNQNNETTDRELRLAASICVKNKSRDYYRRDEMKILISDEEKETCKELILNVLLNETDNVIRGMLAESIRNISEFEYPQRSSSYLLYHLLIPPFVLPNPLLLFFFSPLSQCSWPQLMPILFTNLQNSDILRMFNALTALRKIVKRYEFKHK
jgi:hypothetical protein